MRKKLIDPFIDATTSVLATMAQTKAQAGDPIQEKNFPSGGDVSGMIGLVGNQISGNLVICFDSASILGIVSRMLMEEFKTLSPDVVDAVGEITNMICGASKRTLSELGIVFEMATPMILVGASMELSQFGNNPIARIPFTTQDGTFTVYVQGNIFFE